MKTIKSILLLLFLSTVLFAQIERETRAVWIATNHRLDWPPATYDSEKQKNSLIEIFDNLKTKNFNTIYFQARSNGTVMFKSSFDALSPYINGEVDGDASYDPMKFAIEQAHKHGLEFHAWINVNLVFNGTELKIYNNPNHICQRKPEWIIEDTRDGQKSYWLDPGLPEVRTYISDMITELVENYDVDGIHLDYIRYPGKEFEDDFSFKLYGGGLTRDEFRRKNITSLVREINEKIKSVRADIKLGAAPIGVYRRLKGMISWESYTDLYQDSYGWLKQGIVDYLSPQIYWAINENPRFDVLAKDWKENSNGRNIILGIGAYKENVKPQIDDMIKLSRQLKTAGVAFFRYQNIKDLSLPLFSNKTLPVQTPWLDGLYPAAPFNLTNRKNKDENLFTLNWQVTNPQTIEDSIYYYSIYNLPKVNTDLSSEYLFDVIPSNKNYVTLAIDKPKKVNYYFCLKSVNKLWNESKDASNISIVEVPKMKELANCGMELKKPMFIKDSILGNYVVIQSNVNEQVEIFSGIKKVYSLLKTENVRKGKNYIKINYEPGKYETIKIVFATSKKESELKLNSF